MSATTGDTHIIGAGLAGLAAALSLSRSNGSAGGPRVQVWEAAPRAGGRCRSFHDPMLGRVIDNGAHLALSGNGAFLEFLAEIGARDRVTMATSAAVAFIDLSSGARWTLHPGLGMLFDPSRRPPGVTAARLIGDLWRLWRAPISATVAEVLGADDLAMETLWRPLTVAVLNEPPERAAAQLLALVIKETMARGEAHCLPTMARISLDDALITPARKTCQRRGVIFRFGAPVQALAFAGSHVAGLSARDETVTLTPNDTVIVATAATAARRLIPDLITPPNGATIINIHHLWDGGWGTADAAPPIGVIGGQIDWVFRRDGVISTTTSAADHLADEKGDALIRGSWADVVRVLDLGPAPSPPSRVIKERAATFAATPEANRSRPSAGTRWSNLFLAGDWTASGAPATMEGAIRSGRRAASLVAVRKT